jgi:small subunit ribosomal protein S20
VRSSIKNVLRAIEKGDKSAAEAAYKAAVPAIDRSVSKGIMPLNTAARHKSRLNRHVREMA